MTSKLPALWASNTNYASGPDIGTATKVDPASAPNGFIRGVVAAPQHVNHELNLLTAATRSAFRTQALKLHRITLEGTPITDTAESMAAISRGQGFGVVALKTAQALGINDSDRFKALGVPASITSLVNDAAYNPVTGRIVAIGTGGNRSTYSDDGGATWTAGGTTGGVVQWLVWNAVKSRFIAARGSAVSYSPDDVAAWTAVSSLSIDAVSGGLAVLANGDTVLADDAATPAFRISTDGGATASNASGTVPNDATFDDTGFVAGNGGAAVYHVGRRASGTLLQVSASGDGSNWTSVALFNAPTGAGYASRPRVMLCQNTGLIVVAAPLTSGSGLTEVRASLGGIEWTDAMYVADAPIGAFALAGGRLLFTRDDMLFASDGIGY